METPPIPTPRRLINIADHNKLPVPLPRQRKIESPKVEQIQSDNAHSFESLTKQIADDFTDKVHEGGKLVKHTTKNAKEKIEKTVSQGTKLAKQKIESSIQNTRNARDRVSRSVIEGKNHVTEKFSLATRHFSSMRKEKSSSNILKVPLSERCVSDSIHNTELFDKLQFNSPINEQKFLNDSDLPNYINSSSSCGSSPPCYPPPLLSSNNDNSAHSSLSEEWMRKSFQSQQSDQKSISHPDYSSYSDQTYDLPRNNLLVRSDSWTLYDSVCNATSGSLFNEHMEEPIISRNEVKTESDSQETLDLFCDDSASINFTTDILKPQLTRSKENKSNILSKGETSKPRESMMVEFDPLINRNTTGSSTKNNEMLLLESLLAGDTYGAIFFQNDCFGDESMVDELEYGFYWKDPSVFLSPPTPPERVDSLTPSSNTNNYAATCTDLNLTPKKNEIKVGSSRQTKWFLNSEHESVENNNFEKTPEQDNNGNSSVMTKISNIWKKVPDSAIYLKKKLDQGMNNNVIIPDKLMLQQSSVQYKGLMVRFLAGGIEELFKNFQTRLCVLASQKLTCFSDSTSSVTKEVYNMRNLLSVQVILAHKFSYDGELYCFQMNFSHTGGFKINRGTVVFGCTNETERNIWIQKITESLTDKFPIKYITDVTRIGWCYLKEGISSAWEASWILLSKRTLYYLKNHDTTLLDLDLRKARCIVLQEPDERKSLPTEDGPNLLLDLPQITLYLRMGNARETKIWRWIVKVTASNNGLRLHHQQLTKDNIPTIVDKCINFIYAQGSLSEGIYRKAGSNRAVNDLMQAFKKDAWAIQLTIRNYNEHDVATAIKRFFRELPESVITTELCPAMIAASSLTDIDEKVTVYRKLISTLPTISQNTLKKLLSHLHFIHSLSETNLMNAGNLAAIWGPTLMTSAEPTNMVWSQKEVEVVRDLIGLYIPIYRPSEADIERENIMLDVLRKCQDTSISIPSKPSGKLHVWIYLEDKKFGNCINIVLTPNMTSGDVCKELCLKVKKEYHKVLIEEVICDDNMVRPLHHSELLLDVVLRWGYWDECDRRDNYLVLKDNTLLKEAASIVESPARLVFPCGELKFANEKTKSFKIHMFEFSQAKLTYYKDKTGSIMSDCWRIEDIRWYIGHEAKRNPQSRWSITYIKKNEKDIRSKEKPWFGCTIAGNSREEQLRWIGALMQSEFSNGLLPIPELIVT